MTNLKFFFSNEFNFFYSKFDAHKFNFFFYLWIFITFYFLLNVWKLFFLSISFIYIYTFIFLLFNRLIIYLKYNSLFYLTVAALQLNFLKALQKKDYNYSLFVLFFVLFLFRIFFGVGLRILKCIFIFFDAFYSEWLEANILSKKLNYVIVQMYFKKSIQRFLVNAFIKNADLFKENALILTVRGFKRIVPIYVCKK